jgi:hypothetical protein
MLKTELRSLITVSMAYVMFACTNFTENSQLPRQENFQDLANEYSFTTKELTQSYLSRKIDKWLDTENDGDNIHGYRLLKEIKFASYKHPDLFCGIIAENPDLLATIKNIPEVKDRIEIDNNLEDFILSCYPTTIEAQAYANKCWLKAQPNRSPLDFSSNSALAFSLFYSGGTGNNESSCSCFAFQVSGSCETNTAYNACLAGMGLSWNADLTDPGINYDGSCNGS